MDVNETAKAIEATAEACEYAASQLRQAAIRMREQGDLSYAGEALGIIANLLPQARIDLLAVRPIRALSQRK